MISVSLDQETWRTVAIMLNCYFYDWMKYMAEDDADNIEYAHDLIHAIEKFEAAGEGKDMVGVAE